MPGRSLLRPVVARVVRPLLAALDRRLEQLAARLERHTTNLAAVQRGDLARIDDRLALDVAVLSEHLVGMQRMAGRVTRPPAIDGGGADARLLVVMPGDDQPLPAGARVLACYAPSDDGTWRAVDPAAARVATLRIAELSNSDA